MVLNAIGKADICLIGVPHWNNIFKYDIFDMFSILMTNLRSSKFATTK